MGKRGPLSALGHLLCSLIIVLAGSASGFAATKAVRFKTLVDGSGKAIQDAVVVVEGDRVASLGEGTKAIPSGAEVIDLRRYTGLPGLIDAHTHLTYYYDPEAGQGPWWQFWGDRLPAVTVYLAGENARKTLEIGVTTVRDLGSKDYMDVAMRDLINRGAMPGPRMLVAGHGLMIKFTTSRDEAKYRHDGMVTGSAEIMRVVRQELFGAGADVIKMYASTGGGAVVNASPTFTYEEIKAAVDAAHNLGAKIAVHSYGPEGARDAVRAGADSIEHATDLDEETMREMVRAGIFYVPTVDHNRYYIDEGEIYGHGDAAKKGLSEYIQRNLETTRKAHEAGIKIAMGSDAVFTMNGQNTRELEWFVKAGMTPAEALATATTNAAELLGMEESLGKVAPGYYADLVAVEGDPLEEIGAVITGVRWVMKGGEVVVDKTSRGDEPD